MILGLAGLLSGAAGCGEGTVQLGFRPEAGSTYEYEARVSSRTTTELAGRPPETAEDGTVLEVRQRVLDVSDEGARVEVVLRRPRVGDRAFVMRFDRAAQLTAVESVEGIPATALGELGLSEIFPAAAGAPPSGPLAPGDRWEVDDEVQLPGMAEPTRLTGEGRLTELGVVDGRDTATVTSSVRLPVTTTVSSSTGVRTLEGTQLTETTATFDLGDGAVISSTSVTTGTFRIRLAPPGDSAPPVSGTLPVEGHSRITRED